MIAASHPSDKVKGETNIAPLNIVVVTLARRPISLREVRQGRAKLSRNNWTRANFEARAKLENTLLTPLYCGFTHLDLLYRQQNRERTTSGYRVGRHG